LAGDGECLDQSVRGAVHRGSHRPRAYGPFRRRIQVMRRRAALLAEPAGKEFDDRHPL